MYGLNPLKDIEAKATPNESKNKPTKLRVNQKRKFYNERMKNCVDDNDILMYSTHNEGKSVVAETFINHLECKTSKTMTANDSKSSLIYLNK